MVKPVRKMRDVPGGPSISLKTGRLIEDARLSISPIRSVAFTGALADAGEHGRRRRGPEPRAIISRMRTVLLDARTAEEADLASSARRPQVDTFDAGLEHLASLELIEAGAGGSASSFLIMVSPCEVEDVAGHVEHVAPV